MLQIRVDLHHSLALGGQMLSFLFSWCPFFGSGRLDLRTLNRLVREAVRLPFDDVRLHEKSSSSVWSQRTGVAVGG